MALEPQSVFVAGPAPDGTCWIVTSTCEPTKPAFSGSREDAQAAVAMNQRAAEEYREALARDIHEGAREIDEQGARLQRLQGELDALGARLTLGARRLDELDLDKYSFLRDEDSIALALQLVDLIPDFPMPN